MLNDISRHELCLGLFGWKENILPKMHIVQCSISWADLAQSKIQSIVNRIALVEYVRCNCVNLYFRSTAIFVGHLYFAFHSWALQNQFIVRHALWLIAFQRMLLVLPHKVYMLCTCRYVVDLFYLMNNMSLRVLLKELSRTNTAHRPLNLQCKNDAQLSPQISTKVHVSNAQAQFRGDCPSLQLIACAPG